MPWGIIAWHLQPAWRAMLAVIREAIGFEAGFQPQTTHTGLPAPHQAAQADAKLESNSK